MFHVSMLRKFLRDPDHQIEMEPIAVQQDLTLECRSVRILESLEHVLRKRSIKYVKVLWTNQSKSEATWELEELMRQKYPELFVLGEFR
jgi:N-acetylglutamate synthase-like GNAT family acetyltransferase